LAGAQGRVSQTKKRPSRRREKFRKSIDKSRKVWYHKGVGATGDGHFLGRLKDNRAFGRGAVIFFYCLSKTE
jgi:hypothetical protein